MVPLPPSPPERSGQGGKIVIRGQYIGRRKVPAGQGGGAGVLVPSLDPGVAGGPLLALAGGGRIGGQDGAAGGGAQLPGGLARGFGENLLLDAGGMFAAKAGDLVGDDRRPVAV